MDGKSKASSAVDNACAFLQEFLAQGPKPSIEVEEAAEAHSHSMASLRRAKTKLRIKPWKNDLDGGWMTGLPKAKSMMENEVLDGTESPHFD